MRCLSAAGLVTLLALALIGCTGQRTRSDARSETARLGRCHVFVYNKSAEDLITAVVYIDGVEVLRGDASRSGRDGNTLETWLRLPLGVHHVRAVVGSETTEAEIEVTSVQTCMCQILLYDEPVEFAPGRFSRLSVAQIYPC